MGAPLSLTRQVKDFPRRSRLEHILEFQPVRVGEERRRGWLQCEPGDPQQAPCLDESFSWPESAMSCRA